MSFLNYLIVNSWSHMLVYTSNANDPNPSNITWSSDIQPVIHLWLNGIAVDENNPNLIYAKSKHFLGFWLPTEKLCLFKTKNKYRGKKVFYGIFVCGLNKS